VISSDPTSRITVGPLLAVIVERVNRYFLAFVRLYSLALLHPTNVSINMAEARRKQDQVLGGPLANAARPSTDDRAGALRGPTPIRVGRRFWLVVGALVIVAVFAALIITTVSAASDNARITRMKDHGMGVALTVAYCTGNLSGSGTNIASYSCVGDYSVDGVKYRELVAGMTTYYATGRSIQAQHRRTRRRASKVERIGEVLPCVRHSAAHSYCTDMGIRARAPSQDNDG